MSGRHIPEIPVNKNAVYNLKYYKDVLLTEMLAAGVLVSSETGFPILLSRNLRSEVAWSSIYSFQLLFVRWNSLFGIHL